MLLLTHLIGSLVIFGLGFVAGRYRKPSPTTPAAPWVPPPRSTLTMDDGLDPDVRTQSFSL